MSFIFDRLYGKLSFPKIIQNLLDCPGLLRLQKIGMGNIKFISFPSFSAVTRYEHSIGVCHLADLAAKSLGLSEKDRIELMIASLYHDVTTPPFAHAMEEILKRHFGFDHERHFYELITGRSKDLGGQYAQIYLGRMLKLPIVCQSVQARRIGIDLFRIPELVFGKKDDPLSSLINGDIDLDNIDNIIRAASAMGIEGAEGRLAEILAKSFIFYKNQEIAISADAKLYVKKWKNLRETLYDMILCSIDDFSLQTMLKHALCYLFKSSQESAQLREEDWKLTEEEVFEKIKKHPDARKIYERMLLKKLYKCLNLVWIRGANVLEYVEDQKNLRSLEKLCESVYHTPVICNYYLDKRQRYIQRLFVFFNEIHRLEEQQLEEPSVLVGFFTPDKVYTSYETKAERSMNKQRGKKFMDALREELPSHLLMYSVKMVTQTRYPKIELGKRWDKN